MNERVRLFRPTAVALLVVTLGVAGVAAPEGIPASGEGDSLRGCSIGLAVGDPAGLSFVAQISRRFDLQALIAWDLLSPGGPTTAIDVLFVFDSIHPFGVPLLPYAGLGAKATFLAGDGRFSGSSADYGLGLRLPLGLRHSFTPWPIEAFLEITPGLRWYPDVAFDPDAVIGARIRF
jgi:hypothetical protein